MDFKVGDKLTLINDLCKDDSCPCEFKAKSNVEIINHQLNVDYFTLRAEFGQIMQASYIDLKDATQARSGQVQTPGTLGSSSPNSAWGTSSKFQAGDKVVVKTIAHKNLSYGDETTVSGTGFGIIKVFNTLGDKTQVTAVYESDIELVKPQSLSSGAALAAISSNGWLTSGPLISPYSGIGGVEMASWETEITKTKPKCECGQSAVSASWGDDPKAHSSFCPIFKGSK